MVHEFPLRRANGPLMQPAGTAIRQGRFCDLNGERTIQGAIEKLTESFASKVTSSRIIETGHAPSWCSMKGGRGRSRASWPSPLCLFGAPVNACLGRDDRQDAVFLGKRSCNPPRNCYAITRQLITRSAPSSSSRFLPARLGKGPTGGRHERLKPFAAPAPLFALCSPENGS
jgi:hypothetical protein